MNQILAISLSLLFLIQTIPASAAIKVGLILDRGGKDDKSFNSAAFKGATEAKQKFGIELRDIEATDDSAFEPSMRRFAQKKFDLIVGIGINQAEAIKKIAKEFPDNHFAIVDANVDLPNVASLTFDEHIGSFLVGYVAGLKTKTGTVGFLGGMEIPLIRRFEMAYSQGVKTANPKAKVLVNYVGATSEAWNNPTKAKELASSQFDNKADIIFTAAGASNNGAFDAAAAAKKMAIGCDSNQNYLRPGTILTSMLKRVDTAVFDIIQKANEGKFKGGAYAFNLKNNGIDWALDEHNKALFSEKELQQIAKMREQLKDGKVKVADFYKAK